MSAATVTLTFEGLQDGEAVNNFYNGGTGSLGSSGTNYGINFSSSSLALITGNFDQPPTAPTILFFLSSTAVMNVAGGFDTGFSFFYSAVNQPASVTVYDGLNASGNVLATLALPVTPSHGPPSCNANFCPFVPVGVSFSGTALSVDFGGAEDQVAFDNITLGAAIPGTGNEVPEPSTMLLMGSAAIIVGSFRRFRKA